MNFLVPRTPSDEIDWFSLGKLNLTEFYLPMEAQNYSIRAVNASESKYHYMETDENGQLVIRNLQRGLSYRFEYASTCTTFFGGYSTKSDYVTYSKAFCTSNTAYCAYFFPVSAIKSSSSTKPTDFPLPYLANIYKKCMACRRCREDIWEEQCLKNCRTKILIKIYKKVDEANWMKVPFEWKFAG